MERITKFKGDTEALVNFLYVYVHNQKFEIDLDLAFSRSRGRGDEISIQQAANDREMRSSTSTADMDTMQTSRNCLVGNPSYASQRKIMKTSGREKGIHPM